MNTVTLVGRLTRDPEVRVAQGANPTAVARFTLAVDRRFNRDEETADFISCVAFGKTAQFVEKYFSKGMRMGLTGRLQISSYTNKEGKTVHKADVIAESVEFVESKQQAAPAHQEPVQYQPPQQTTWQGAQDGFIDIAPVALNDDGLPFN